MKTLQLSPSLGLGGAHGAPLPWAIVIGVFFSCYLTWRPSEDIMFTLSDAMFLLGFGQLIYHHRIPLEPMRFLTAFWIAGFLMLVGGLLAGSLYCPTPSRWLIVASQYCFAWVVLPMILLRRGQVDTAKLLQAFVWGVFAMNLFGAIVYFCYTGSFDDAHNLFGLDFLSGGRRLGAFASDANWNGAVLAMAVPAAIYLRAKGLAGNLVCLMWMTILLLGVMLTASFTAFLCAIAGLAIFTVVGGILPSRRTWIVLALCAVAAAIFFWERGGALPNIFVERVGNAISNGDISEAGTFEGRLALIKEAWGMADKHMLLGVGADQYRVISALKAPVHNMYLLLWVEGGLISMFGWIVMLSVLFAAAIKAYPQDRLATALTLSTSGTFLIASTASPHMYARLWSVPVLLALAVSIDMARDPGPAEKRKAALRQAESKLARLATA